MLQTQQHLPDDCRHDDLQNNLLLLTDNWLLEMLSLLIVVNVSSLLEICHFKCINADISEV